MTVQIKTLVKCGNCLSCTSLNEWMKLATLFSLQMQLVLPHSVSHFFTASLLTFSQFNCPGNSASRSCILHDTERPKVLWIEFTVLYFLHIYRKHCFGENGEDYRGRQRGVEGRDCRDWELKGSESIQESWNFEFNVWYVLSVLWHHVQSAEAATD